MLDGDVDALLGGRPCSAALKLACKSRDGEFKWTCRSARANGDCASVDAANGFSTDRSRAHAANRTEEHGDAARDKECKMRSSIDNLTNQMKLRPDMIVASSGGVALP